MSAASRPTPILTPPPPPPSAPPPGGFFKSVERFMERITEGLELNQIWQQFRYEARSGYQLYSREIEKSAGVPSHGFKLWLHRVGEFFWAVMMKLSPAKRILLLLALFLLVGPIFSVEFSKSNVVVGHASAPFWGGLLLLLLLVMEVADRVVMKRDLEIARDIQQWLVPSKPPILPGLEVAFVTRPANTVAGDYYDAFLRDTDSGKRVLLTIADVAGKSVPAALLMATYQASLKTLSATPSSLSQLVGGMNKYACDHSVSGSRFTTAFLAEFDADTRNLLYVNAGHNAPYLRRASGALEKMEKGGLPLGITNDAVYEQGRVSLIAGDVLVIYTDGVVEAENGTGEEFGDLRLMNTIAPPAASADELMHRVMNQVQSFTQLAPQHDDITCMIVRVTGA